MLLTLSEKTKELIAHSNDRQKTQYLEYQIKKQERLWISKYDSIKADSWPVCCCYDDFYLLSPEIQHECIIYHKFSPEIWIQSIHNDARYKFQVPDFLDMEKNKPMYSFLTNNVHIVENKKIIDFACNIGHWSFFAAMKNGRQVLGIDVRPENLAIANSIKKNKKTTSYNKRISFIKSDIHNYKKNSELCSGMDTVFLFGIMYHVHDHFEILRSICQTDVKYVAIETGIYEHDKPVIWWKTEPSFENISGWCGDQRELLVGYPSVSYFDFIFNDFGFTKTAQDSYMTNVSATKAIEFLRPRAMMIYGKL